MEEKLNGGMNLVEKKTINEFKKLYCKKDLLGIKWHAVLLKEAFTR